MAKLKTVIQGVWCREDNKFYYLDTGIHSINSGTQRVISTLTARNLIHFDPQGRQTYGMDPYKIMTIEQAREKNYEIVRLTINEPTAQMPSQTEAAPTKLGAWGK